MVGDGVGSSCGGGGGGGGISLTSLKDMVRRNLYEREEYRKTLGFGRCPSSGVTSGVEDGFLVGELVYGIEMTTTTITTISMRKIEV
ncbi:hypothetical protein M0804_014151 [Polistes exclamans]|nr:hypothetical protein M0804_014152 [Polistes exclamans]KAI4475679.1 hypothetical protein M0804_014151 [Polistes exclamans]